MSKFICLCMLVAIASVAKAELLPETMDKVEVLPTEYPDSWIYAQDVNFDAMIAGRVVIVDVTAEDSEYKGSLDAAQLANFSESSKRSELYVAETFHARNTRGERTDFLTIYDKSTLNPIAEIPLVGGKRAQLVSNKYAMQIIDDDNYLLLFNFSPAASVSIIDLNTRAILGEAQIPGCSLIYPTGVRGFSSLCGNGSLITTKLAEDGRVIGQQRMANFFDVDADPLFDKPAYIGTTAYFGSFLGDVQPINFSTYNPVIEERWSLVSEREKKAGWRPSGWEIFDDSKSGHLYVLMSENGYDGSHKDGGQEVWVFDVDKKERVRRIKLKTPGFSIAIIDSNDGKLVVTNLEMNIDVYTLNGKWESVIDNVAAMPIVLHTKR